MIDLPNYKTYFGGKQASGVYQTIINHISKHMVYIEPFLGRGTIMRLKKPAPHINVGYELDKQLFENWSIATKGNPNFAVYNSCGISVLEYFSKKDYISGFTGSDVFIYADPPYLFSTRRSTRKQYKHEFTVDDHKRFLTAAANIKFNVAISCYDNDLYSSMLHGWRKINFKSQTRRGTAIETLYMNYSEPVELHDYSFLGKNFRERERIKQKIKRNVERLQRLPLYERTAIIQAIAENVKTDLATTV